MTHNELVAAAVLVLVVVIPIWVRVGTWVGERVGKMLVR